MTSREEARALLLQGITDYIQVDPEVIGLIYEVLSKGLHTAFMQSQERAADMEALLVITSSKKWLKALGGNPAIKEKLLKWKDKTALQWDTLYETLTGEKAE